MIFDSLDYPIWATTDKPYRIKGDTSLEYDPLTLFSSPPSPIPSSSTTTSIQTRRNESPNFVSGGLLGGLTVAADIRIQIEFIRRFRKDLREFREGDGYF